MRAIQAKAALKYAILPGVIPRVRALFQRGFGQLALLLAGIYQMARLLPPGHPYLRRENIGKFGIRHVIAAAANNLTLSRRNADQVLIFGATLLGVALLFLQCALVIYGLIIHAAMAAPPIATPPGMTSLFATPDPKAAGGAVTDIAFLLLDQVFGVPRLFCTIGAKCTAINAALPWPFHKALHALFQFYSLGMLLVGVLIFLYYVVVIVGETAVTGSPFGQRFKNAWTPVRLVVAIGLLLPLNFGLNSAQYIVLYAAKFGSGFATNGWNTFVNTVTAGTAGRTVFSRGGSNPIGERTSLLATPLAPDLTPVVQFMTITHFCEYAYWKDTQRTPPAQPLDPTSVTNPATFPKVQPYFVKRPLKNGDAQTYSLITPGTSYQQALNFYDKGDIIIRFGERNEAVYKDEIGNVRPWCGDIRINIGDRQNLAKGRAIGGTDYIQETYYELIKEMWFGQWSGDGAPPATNAGQNMRRLAYRFFEVGDDTEPGQSLAGNYFQCNSSINNIFGKALPDPDCEWERPDAGLKQQLIDKYNAFIDAKIKIAWDKYNKNGVDIQMKPEIMDRGWAGAGIWYNIIAQINGAFSNAVQDVPRIESYSIAMKKTSEQRRQEDSNITNVEAFTPNISKSGSISIEGDANILKKATQLGEFFSYWNSDGINQSALGKNVTGEVFRDMISSIFGGKGLFSMQGENAHIHPLAQLTGLGKSLIDMTIFSLGMSAVSSGVAPILAALGVGGASTPVLQFFSGLWSSVGMITLICGLVLYYVVPFLPFLYFFFAVGTWVMSIFEAMVGVPLWALAHLRLDGEGLPGDSASNGYFLIFEIFLRPILSVFGLVAALVIFAAQVRALHMIWALVLGNLTGYAPGVALQVGEIQIPRDAVDQFCFSVIYVIIVYMMATASFKMIDRIADNILRYMGAGVSTFSGINDDARADFSRYIATGGLTVGDKLFKGVSETASGIGGLGAQIINPKAGGG